MDQSNIWSRLKWFSPRENWGSPDLMDHEFLLELDQCRTLIGLPFVVVSGNGGVHAPESKHYKNIAADIVIPNWRDKYRSWFDLFLDISRFRFGGIGFYPHGQYHGRRVGSWHLDTRRAPIRAYWLGVEHSQGLRYLELSQANLGSALKQLGEP